MGATASLSTTHLSVEPGQEVTCTVVVRNTGGVVDQFRIDVVGDAARFATVDTNAVNLMPATSIEVTVRFAPPRSPDVVAGTEAFAIRVTSQEDPRGSAVEEGVLEVLPFTDVAIEIVPAKAEGSRRANFEVVVDNLGNHPVTVTLQPNDPEDDLDFWLEREEVQLDPGTAAFIRMQAKPKRRFFRGPPQRHPFQIRARAADRESVVAEGSMVQRQLMPKWLLPALLGLLALLALLIVLWFTVLRPTVYSAAEDAVAKKTKQLNDTAQQAKKDAGAAKSTAAKAEQKSNRAMRAVGLNPNSPAPGGAGGAGEAGIPPEAVINGEGEPIDFRIAAPTDSQPDRDKFTNFAFPKEDQTKTIVITDLILQNPKGDTGTLRILRDVDGKQTVLLEVGLGNFRDLDQHWLQPWVFRPGQKVVVAVSCQNPQAEGRCSPAVSFTGRSSGGD
jgi:hypothetical protein